MQNTLKSETFRFVDTWITAMCNCHESVHFSFIIKKENLLDKLQGHWRLCSD